MSPVFFTSPAEFRHWLEENHASARELLVGFHRVGSGRPSLTWPESVDEALCFGWIDGVRRSLDAQSYTIRFTPRRCGSVWSAVNIKRAGELIAAGRMQPAGLAAFEARREHRSRIYAYEQRSTELPPACEARFRRLPAAWEFFAAQPPGYRKKLCWWVASAKQQATRLSRLEKLIAASAERRRL